MEKVSSRQYKIIPALIISLALLIGAFYSSFASATETIPQPPGTQLAWFVGYHNYYGGGYYRPNYVYSGPRYRYRNVHWTGWRYVGYHCQRTCLVNNWDGRVLRCNRRCF